MVFDPLTQEEIEEIVDLMMAVVGERLAEHGVTAELTLEARKWLADSGFDPTFGARPLRRAVQRHVENPLSKKILGRRVQDRRPCGSRCKPGRPDL